MRAATLCMVAARRQRGVYAIEYAFVFLFFFALIYTVICYAMVFAFRFGLQNAAEDGARAALRYQKDLPARQAKAKEVACTRTLGWLPAATCPISADSSLQIIPVIEKAGTDCGPTWDMRCQIVVTVTFSNLNSVLPPFPGFAIPTKLTAEARLLLDGRSL